MLKKRRF